LVRFEVAAAVFLLSAADNYAANIRWSGQGGNTLFHNTGNWAGGLIPGVADVAQFGRSVQLLPQIYTVTFNNNATNQSLEIEDDQVTFDLNSRTYSVTSAAGVLVGVNTGNFAGRLTILDGTLSTSTKIDVGAAGNRVGFLTVGAGGLITGAADLNVGQLATGTLTVQAGGDISLTRDTTIGVGAGINGTATIIGDGTIGSATLLTRGLDVGNNGNGTVNVQLGGLLQNSATASIGGGNLFTGVGTGTVNVMNPGSVWNSQGLLKVGDVGTGEVNVALGGKITSVDSIVGADVSNSGEVNVEGTNSLWDNSGTLTVGGLGNGTLNIMGQGVVDTMNAVIGASNLPTSNGTVNVSGAGSLWTVINQLDIGDQGTGTLTIMDGGRVDTTDGIVGNAVGSGTVTVSGSDSRWQISNQLQVGLSGEGALRIEDGGTVHNKTALVGGSALVTASSSWVNEFTLNIGLTSATTAQLTIESGSHVHNGNSNLGISQGGKGIAVVRGGGTTWVSTEALNVGLGGEGDLTIESGAAVTSVGGGVARIGGSKGTARINGSDTSWTTSGDFVVGGGDGRLEINSGQLRFTNESDLIVGSGGSGQMTISAGGQALDALETIIGNVAEAAGELTVTGPNSLLRTLDRLTVGLNGSGTLLVSDGGRVTNDVAILGGIDSIVRVQGANSSWENRSVLNTRSNAAVVIEEGGAVTCVGSTIGVSAGDATDVTVSNATWSNSGYLNVGGGGAGSMSIEAGGQVSNLTASIGALSGSNGTVLVNGAGSSWTIDGPLFIGGGEFGDGGIGSVRIQSGGTVDVAQHTVVFASDQLQLAGGTFRSTDISFQGGGVFEWTSGTLHPGIFRGSLEVPAGGVLAPGNSVGSTEVRVHYSQMAGSTLQIEIAGPVATEHDRVTVVGDAVLGGNLHLTLLEDSISPATSTLSIFVARSISGAFDNVANGQRLTTTDGGGSFVVNYGAGSAFDPDQVVLSNFLPSAGLRGDFDLNGDVDGHDFLIWQHGGSPTQLSGSDLADWRMNFGRTASLMATTAVVPEPATMAICLTALGLFATSRRSVWLSLRWKCLVSRPRQAPRAAVEHLNPCCPNSRRRRPRDVG